MPSKHATIALAEGEPVYLTNALVEDTEQLSADDFAALGLEAGTLGPFEYDDERVWFPATASEQRFLAEDSIEPPVGGYARLGYLVLYQGRKYFSVCYVDWYGQPAQTEQRAPTEEERLASIRRFNRLVAALTPLVVQLGGWVLARTADEVGDNRGEGDDAHVAEILLPTDVVCTTYAGMTDYTDGLLDLFEQATDAMLGLPAPAENPCLDIPTLAPCVVLPPGPPITTPAQLDAALLALDAADAAAPTSTPAMVPTTLPILAPPADQDAPAAPIAITTFAIMSNEGGLVLVQDRDYATALGKGLDVLRRDHLGAVMDPEARIAFLQAMLDGDFSKAMVLYQHAEKEHFVVEIAVVTTSV